ncbi:phosphatidylserine decarboxylase [Coraliomargarita sp. SDUM461004]|uniref:Phosphatidylserine decarboxylase n=1 Tax=Thalassobacterium sedimentorum TaxID=3041258 RepID=A0ABU1AFL7_9BACT|nr:phosphatidylserine decarboxylase [Coraliomargarita sp. SDUM461004]MDQ8193622.1 phosphatidylserine decarboxylase [Coraliomargarita sp. SDUM461004]
MNFAAEYNAPIEYYNRHTGAVETESVYGEGFLRWAYGNPLGRLTVAVAVKRLWFSKWYGWRMDFPRSREKVAPFIQNYGVDIEEFADAVGSYGSFNEFFYRRLKSAARPVDPDPQAVVFPADGRHLGIENVDVADRFYIKGQRFDLEAFVGDPSLAQEFAGGTMVISRLCPVDYHRYHFPVAGEAGPVQVLPGTLRSVSPLALRRHLSILWENRRARTVIQSPTFGKVIVMEVGATCVGGMHSTFTAGSVAKGSEKGYFSFGGSCVTTIYQRGAVQLEPDLLEQAALGREVYAKMGERSGAQISAHEASRRAIQLD